MIINGSPDITDLLINVTWDLSGTTPVTKLENLSTGANLAGVSWAFFTASPSQTPIHEGDINDPDVEGVWATFLLSNPWPRPFNNIEWGNYTFYCVIKDSNGNVYTSTIQPAFICRPFGNTELSKNTFGIASSDVKVQCNNAAVFFQDTTYHEYKGISGTQISSVLRVIYPIDETLTIPDPFVAAQYSTALVPVTYSSNNYQFVQTTIYNYEVSPNTFIQIKYQTIQTFAVWCNVDLLPLVCEVNKLIDSIETGNCSDVNEAQRKLNLITPKFLLVFMGILQPLTGIDVPVVIEEIKVIGGFECNCCGAPSGIIPTSATSVIAGYNFLVNKLGGDITNASDFTTNGNNITLNIGDVSYIVKVANNSPNDINSFSFSSSLSSDGFTKTYSLVIDGTLLATEILNIIKNDSSLVNLFNSIVTINTGGSGNLIVDGKCIFNTSNSCDYTWGFTFIPAAPTNAILTGVLVNGANLNLNFAFNQSNLSSLQSYLNGLGIGTFVVTNLGSGTVSVTSTGNTNNLGAMTYNVASVDKLSKFASDCTGFVPLSANQVIQNLIDYLCGLDDSEVVTSQDYEICYIDPSSQQKVIKTVPAGESLTSFIQELLLNGCKTIDYVISLGALNCGTLRKVFPQTPDIMQANDVLFGTKAGQCAGIYPVEAGLRMMQLGIYNADYVNAFCALVAACQGGFICEPYTIYQLQVIDGSPANTTEIVIEFSHPSAISNIIRYARTDNTTSPVYTTIPNVLPGQSPYVIANLPEGSYVVDMTPIYSDGRSCPPVSLNTGFPTGGFSAFSSRFDGTDIIVSYSAPVGMPKVRVNINYPNGGTFSQVYTNTGTDITIAPPSGIYGTYTITMTPVYNETTSYFGETTAPSVIEVTPPNNSTLINNTSNQITSLSMIITDGNNQTIVPFSVASVAGGGGVVDFYVPVITTASILISFGTGSVGEAYLVAASTFIGSVTPNHITFDTSDTIISSGITVNLIDPSPAP